MRFLQVFVVVTCLIASVPAQVHVPGDYSELQDAIDASAPGATILIHGGEHGSIVIDKPLTLVGESLPVLAASFNSMTGKKVAAITLAGPGSGVVTLIGLRTTGTLQEGFVGFGEPGIFGSGFDQLRVLHAEIEGTGPVSAGASEPLQGTHGIDVTVPYVLVEDSVVKAGATVHGSGGPVPPTGASGIHAPFSTVTLLDSQVSGGLVHDVFVNEFFVNCPATCAGFTGGSGGTGLVAAQLYRANSGVAGGAGATFTCNQSGLVCAKPDGAALEVAQLTELQHDLQASGPLVQGEVFTLTWFSLGQPALLLASMLSTPPVTVGMHGQLFLDAGQAWILAVPGGGVREAAFVAPTASVLLGVSLAFQVFDPQLGLTRPAFAAFVP